MSYLTRRLPGALAAGAEGDPSRVVQLADLGEDAGYIYAVLPSAGNGSLDLLKAMMQHVSDTGLPFPEATARSLFCDIVAGFEVPALPLSSC